MLEALSSILITTVLPSLATVIAGMLVVVLKRMLAKHGIDLTDAQDQRLTNIVAERIRAAEEYARREAKAGFAVSGSAKLDRVVEETLATVKHDPTLPDPTPARVKAIVDSTLPLVRRVLPSMEIVDDLGE